MISDNASERTPIFFAWFSVAVKEAGAAARLLHTKWYCCCTSYVVSFPERVLGPMGIRPTGGLLVCRPDFGGGLISTVETFVMSIVVTFLRREVRHSSYSPWHFWGISVLPQRHPKYLNTALSFILN